MKRTKHLLVLASLLGSMYWGGPTQAFAAGVDAIHQIRVQGIQRVEADTVKSYLVLEEGGTFDAEAIRRSVRALYDTGFFKDVSLERVGNDLLVRVEENPMISELTIEGNESFTKDEIDKFVQAKAKTIYNKAKSERDLSALRSAYRTKGLFLADVQMVVKPLEENRVQVIYRVKEGDKSKVRDVRVIGHQAFSEKDLTRKLMIQPSNWLSWFSDDDAYDREKLIHDQDEIRFYYQDRGYAKAKVESSVAELTPDRRAFVVTHTIQEGERYRFGTIKIDTDFDEKPQEELRLLLTTLEGEWFSREQLRKSTEKLSDAIGDNGYAFLNIQPETRINDETHVVDVTYKAVKGKRVYLNRIDIIGNTRTKDEVIRRELRLAEGDRFSSSQVKRSKERLKNLNYFENVEVVTPATGETDRVNALIKVEEKSTGTFTIGAGYSSTENFIATAGISQSNFLGNGQAVSLSLSRSSRTTNFDFSFTEPYFLGKDLSAGIDLFDKKVDQSNYASYSQKSYGGGVRLGFGLSEYLRDAPSYQLAHIEISDVVPGAASAIWAQAAKSPYLQSMVSNTLQYDSRDNRLLTTTGQYHKFTTDVAGLGGDIHFVRAQVEGNIYRPLFGKEEWVAHLKGRVGVIEGLGEDVPLFQHFYMGGSQSVRGFKPGGIGPRTVEGDAFGGTSFEQVNAELYFPLFNLGEKGVRGIAFFDAGSLNSSDKISGVKDTGSVRMAAGAGVHWNSPFGPLRFEVAVPIKKEDSDTTRSFDFSIGTNM